MYCPIALLKSQRGSVASYLAARGGKSSSFAGNLEGSRNFLIHPNAHARHARLRERSVENPGRVKKVCGKGKGLNAADEQTK